MSIDRTWEPSEESRTHDEKRDALRAEREATPKKVICGHEGCFMLGLYIVSWEAPDHPEFRGQTHDCCRLHAPKGQKR